MNLRQDPKTREIGWKINVDGIHQAFTKEIAQITFADDGAPRYDGPCLFVGGADSDYIPVSDHDEIKETFTTAEFVYIQGAGHWVHSQQPAAFLNTVLPVFS